MEDCDQYSSGTVGTSPHGQPRMNPSSPTTVVWIFKSMDRCVTFAIHVILLKGFPHAVKALVSFEEFHEWIASPIMETVFDHNKFVS